MFHSTFVKIAASVVVTATAVLFAQDQFVRADGETRGQNELQAAVANDRDESGGSAENQASEQKSGGKPTSPVKVGSRISLRLSGDLAIKYLQRIGTLRPSETAPDGMSVETSAVVSRRLKNGQYHIEHSHRGLDSDNKPRLVTLTCIVNAKQVMHDVIPRGRIYSSPADIKNEVKPVQTKKDARVLRLEMSNLKRLRLQVWSLSEEIGN